MGIDGEDDPFTQVYRALWRMAERHPLINEKIKQGNRIRYDEQDNIDPNKDNAAHGDMPELTLLSRTVSGNLHASSNSSQVIRQYEWWLATADYRVTEALHPIEWGLVCAMAGWKEVLGRLTWRGKTFCKMFDAMPSIAGFSDPARANGINGWAATWSAQVTMYFDTAKMTEILTEVT